jgi:signal peptidase I
MEKTELREMVTILRKSLEDGREPHLTITSNSMAPLLRTGDQIILAKASLTDLYPGEIITIEKDTHLLTHRYWGCHHSKIISRGDRPLRYDPPSAKNSILGRVIIRKRNDKYLYFTTGLGFWLNKHLTWLAHLENLLYIQSAIETSECNNVNWAPYIHKLLYLWGSVLAHAVEIIAGKNYQPGVLDEKSKKHL